MKKFVFLALLALAGCSRGADAPPRDAAAAPAPIAVAQGVVDAEGGLIRVRAPRDGVIDRSLVEEGDHVVAGQPLAALQDRQVRLDLDVAAADVAQRQAQADLAAAKAQGAEREAQRLSRLAEADAATRQDAERAATAATVARGEQREAAAALSGAKARRQLGAYEVQVRSVRAPVSGRVVRRTTAPGAFVSAATSLFVLEPDGRRVVRAELDEAFAGRVRPNMTAVVTRQFQPGKSYAARVLRVSDVLAGPSLPDDPTAKADARVVTVVLTLTGAQDLRLGERVLVRFTP
jgi:RND family efflux transporter MFP subunit